MIRLYDRLMASDLEAESIPWPGKEGFWSGTRDAAFELLPQATVIDVENVVEYFHRFTPEQGWGFEDFPNLAPPLENFFLESRTPPHLLQERGSGVYGLPYRWGIQFFGGDLWAQPELRKLRRGDATQEAAIDRPETRWDLEGFVFVEWEKGKITGPVYWFQLGILPNGSPWKQPNAKTPQFYLSALSFPRVLVPQVPAVLRIPDLVIHDLIAPFLLGISLMHCRNVKQREFEPSRALSKKHRKRTGRDLVRYHVLEIEPMKQVLQSEGSADSAGLKRALHLCRGHFRTYEEKPLFGKIRGTFWIPQHLRGDKAEGMVLKDYELDAPTR